MVHSRMRLILILGIFAASFDAHAQSQPVSGNPASADKSSPAPADALKAPSDEMPKGLSNEAKQQFIRAMELYEEQNYAAALVELRAAFDSSRSYEILFHVGKACLETRDYVCSLRSFEDYLAQGKEKVPAEKRALVEKEVAGLRSRVSRLMITTNVPAARVSIDDVPVGLTPFDAPLVVSIGQRKITVVKEGRIPITQSVDVAGASVTTVDLKLQELVSIDRTVRIHEAPPRMTTLTWVGLGASAALAVGAVVTGVMANGASNDLSDMRWAGTVVPDNVESKRSDGKSLALATDILAGAAIVTLGTTLALTFMRPLPPKTGETTTTSRLQIGPRGIVFKGAF